MATTLGSRVDFLKADGWSSMLQSASPDAKTLGWPIHMKALQCIHKIKEKFERQYTWIDEALIEAKKTFATPEIHMIPKTPSAKKSRRVIQQVIEEEDDDDFESAQPRKKTRTAKGKGRGKKAAAANTSQDVAISSEASIDTEQETSASESCSTSRPVRNSRKATSNRSTRNTRRKKPEESEEEMETADSGPVMNLAPKIEEEEKQRICSIAGNDEEGSVNDDQTAKQQTAETCLKLETVKSEAEQKDTEQDSSVIVLDSDESQTPVVKTKRSSRVIKEAVRRSEARRSSRTATPTPTVDVVTTLADTPQSPRSAPEPKGRGTDKKPFHMLNVKEKATKYEELVRKSTGGREGSPAENRITPKSQRLCQKLSGSAKSVTPRTPQTIRKNTASTPSTFVSKQVLTMKKNVLNNLGASPRHTNIKVKPVSVEKESARHRLSCRVSGSKLSLSRRRSSIQRHKDRLSTGKVVMTHLDEIKARLDHTAPGSSGDEFVKSPAVRSTRSKMRLAKQEIEKPKTPEPPKPPTRSKLRLNKNPAASGSESRTDTEGNSADSATPPRRATRSKMRVNKPAPPTLPLASDSDEGSGTPDVGYKNVQPPSTMAPVRSTRSKMRNLEKQESACSPLVKKQAPGLNRSDSAKRPAKHSDDNVSPQKKRHIQDSPDCFNGTVSHTPPRCYTPSHASSFLHNLKKNRTTPLSNMNTMVTSFLSRNTPTRKPSTKEILEQKRKQLLVKERQEEDRLQKRQEYLHKKAEDQRKKRENRQLLAAKRREEQTKKENEAKKGLTQKHEEKKMLSAKLQEEKQKEEREKQRQRDKKIAEAELRRKQEEELRQQKLLESEQEQQRMKELQQRKKEYEEQERLKRIAEQRRAQEERIAEMEKERLRDIEKLRQQEEQRQREENQLKKEREERDKKEKAERDRQELERQKERQRQKNIELEKQREAERQRVLEIKRVNEEQRRAQEEEKRLQKLIKSHNNTLQSNTSLNQQNTSLNQPAKKPQLNTTVTMDTSSSSLNTTYNKEQNPNTSQSEENTESYKITPVRKVYKPATQENYNIQDLKSDDSTDDEDQPRKKIPAWATGPQLKAAIINQYYRPPDLDTIFPVIEAPDLCKLFAKKKAKFFKRTSSAVWHTPIYMPSGKPLE